MWILEFKNVLKELAGCKDSNDARMKLMDNVRSGVLFGILFAKQVITTMLAVFVPKIALLDSEMMVQNVENLDLMEEVQVILGNLEIQ